MKNYSFYRNESTKFVKIEMLFSPLRQIASLCLHVIERYRILLNAQIPVVIPKNCQVCRQLAELLTAQKKKKKKKKKNDCNIEEKSFSLGQCKLSCAA